LLLLRAGHLFLLADPADERPLAAPMAAPLPASPAMAPTRAPPAAPRNRPRPALVVGCVWGGGDVLAVGVCIGSKPVLSRAQV
jgi:hypothetical protein